MPIDPRIALGYQPPATQSPLNVMAQMQSIQNARQENAMRQAQMANYESEAERRNALLPAELAKAESDRKTAELGRDSAFNKLVGDRMETSRRLLETVTTPEAYIAWHEANHTDPVLGEYLKQRGVTAEQARAGIVAALQKPGGFDELLRNSRLGLEKAMENHFQTQDYGGGERIVVMPRYGAGAARVVEGSDIKKTATPGELLTDERERQHQRAMEGKESTKDKAAREKQESGAEQFDAQIMALEDAYGVLKTLGGIKSTTQGAVSNILTSAATQGPGGVLGRLAGTDVQSKRNEIKNARLLLLQSIKQATGMSAQQLNSNVELKNWLDAVTNPDNDYESNIATLKNIKDFVSKNVARAAATDGVVAPAAAIEYLRKNPKMAADFDAKYGAGAAAKVLGK